MTPSSSATTTSPGFTITPPSTTGTLTDPAVALTVPCALTCASPDGEPHRAQFGHVAHAAGGDEARTPRTCSGVAISSPMNPVRRDRSTGTTTITSPACGLLDRGVDHQVVAGRGTSTVTALPAMRGALLDRTDAGPA